MWLNALEKLVNGPWAKFVSSNFWSSINALPPLAVAIYTGMETKMALNYQSKSQKRSAVEK